MVLCHASEPEKPVCKSQIAADGEAEVSHLGLERVREVWQARLPRPSPGICPVGLERRFHVEDDDLRRIVVHQSIQVLRADGAHLIDDELPKLSFVACLGTLGCCYGDRLLWAGV